MTRCRAEIKGFIGSDPISYFAFYKFSGKVEDKKGIGFDMSPGEKVIEG